MPKNFENDTVKVDGLYGASQFHLRVKGPMDEAQRKTYGEIYAKMIDAVMNERWIPEMPTDVPHYPRVGKPWIDLSGDTQAEIIGQLAAHKDFPLVHSHRDWHWWKADGSDDTIRRIRATHEDAERDAAITVATAAETLRKLYVAYGDELTKRFPEGATEATLEAYNDAGLKYEDALTKWCALKREQ